MKPSWKTHSLANPAPAPLDLRKGQRVRAIVDLPGAPQGTEGRVLLRNGFVTPRYFVQFDNGAEHSNLDSRSIEALG